MKIAVIGAGNVGSTLGKAWAKQGHQVTFGSRNPTSEKTQAMLVEVGYNVEAKTNQEAVADAEAVVLATPWEGTQEALVSCGNLTNKIILDCTNPLLPKLAGLEFGLTTSGGEKVAEWAPGAFVYKTFNQTGFNIMANPTVEGRKAAIFVCGDAQHKPTVLKLVEEVGFEAIDAGDLTTARLVEPLALLWIKLALFHGQGRDFAFGILRRGET